MEGISQATALDIGIDGKRGFSSVGSHGCGAAGEWFFGGGAADIRWDGGMLMRAAS